ncbi:MAG: HD domain-containing protein [Methanobacteriota archaeon]|nr:MAG: HD domain-containing protein [Euryarchaeota archaeon]
MDEYKVIRDSIHGSVRVGSPYLPLIESNELQRLHGIHQLGLASLVYPGANHTRLEHSLGAFAVAGRMSTSLQLEEDEEALVRCAALLHDIGHLPYSHTFEMVLHERFGIDHVEISKRLIMGDDSVVSEDERRALGEEIRAVDSLERQGIEPKVVAALLSGSAETQLEQLTLNGHKEQAHFNGRRYLGQMISGPVDVDQLDYLTRDAHYTGVAYGVIDVDRLLDTVGVFNGDLVVEKGGASAVEGMLVARALMFSTVYFHKTIRIAELMLAKAVELLDSREIKDLFKMTDSSLLSRLSSEGGYSQEIATRIKYRRLFKKAYAVANEDVGDDGWEAVDELGDFDKRRSLEEDIAARAGIDPGHVVIDVPSHELPVSEPRMTMTNIRITDGDRVRLLPSMSTIAHSLQTRRVHEWAIMVACPTENADKVARAAKKAISI